MDFRAPLEPGKGVRLAHEMLRGLVGAPTGDEAVRAKMAGALEKLTGAAAGG